jgi:hypothetical protein
MRQTLARVQTQDANSLAAGGEALGSGGFEKATSRLEGDKQLFDIATQSCIAAASLLEKRQARFRGTGERPLEKSFDLSPAFRRHLAGFSVPPARLSC